MQINPAEQGIVIEHLLKMGYEPLSICCITVKATSNLVIGASLSHLFQGYLHHFQSHLIMSTMEIS